MTDTIIVTPSPAVNVTVTPATVTAGTPSTITVSALATANVLVTSPIINTGTSAAPIIGINQASLFASPTFTGTPLAPTATAGTNTYQLATTAFVGTAVSNLVNSAPATLDTLNELATALNNDPAFATTIAASIGSKEPAITAGTTAQYLRGDKSLATFPTAVSSFTNDSAYITSSSLPVASSTNPIVDGTVAIGSSTTYARADHVHPTDTSRASSSHVHGNISNTGTITSAVTLGATPKLIIADTSNNIGSYTPTGTASATTYLSGTGVWATPAGGTSSSYYVSTIGFTLDFTVSASAQSILTGGSGGTVGVTVAADTTYEYEVYFRIAGAYGLSGAQTPSFGLTATTLTLSPVLAYNHFIETGSNVLGYTTNTSLTLTGTTTTKSLTALTTGTVYYFLKVRGVFRVTGTGTAKVYPSLSMNTANVDNVWLVPAGGVVFKATQVGNGTVSSVGVS